MKKRNYKDISGSKPAQAVAILALIVLVPIILILNIIIMLFKWPFDLRDKRRLRLDIKNTLIPAKKYIFIRYSSEDKLSSYVDDLSLKYPEVLAIKYEEEKDDWENNWSKLSTKTETRLILNVNPDYDQAYIMIASIDKQKQRYESGITITEYKEGYIENLSDKTLTEEQAKKRIIEYITQAIKQWNG